MVLLKENHMQLTEAATLDRKSGKPRDLQFPGPFLETRNTMLKQNCHLDRTRISYHAALDIAACTAFVKESSMKCANATKFHRKSGGA